MNGGPVEDWLRIDSSRRIAARGAKCDREVAFNGIVFDAFNQNRHSNGGVPPM